MFSLYDQPTRLCDGISRREWLRVGGLGALGLSLPQFLQTAAAQETNSKSFGRAKSCIVLFLLGGPPQHETWDPKPEAPVEVRGPYHPIASATPGLMVGELMPLTAKLTDKIAVLRATSTDDNAHSSSGYWMLTGVPHTPKNAENALPGFPNNWPCMGAVVRRLRGDQAAMPASIRLPEEIWNTGHIVWPGQDAGWLGDSADPWLLTCDPNKADFQVSEITPPPDIPPLRIDRRKRLFDAVNGHLDQLEATGGIPRWDGLRQKAFELIGSQQARSAFELSREPDAMRDRYGRNRFGQSVLLARRLVEAGVTFVQVNWTRWETDTSGSPAWDNHQNNAQRLKEVLMPPMDQAYSALLEDLAQRGMLDETLVVWMGEFGRTPRHNAAGGRDHWGHVFSTALAGGGIRGGVVHGSSDRQGAYPVDGRIEPQDLTATIFHCLGIPIHSEVRDSSKRPYAITRGQVISQIVT